MKSFWIELSFSLGKGEIGIASPTFIVDKGEIYVGDGLGDNPGEGIGDGMGVGNRDGMDESNGAGIGVGEGAGLIETFAERFVGVSKPTVTLFDVRTVVGIVGELDSTTVTLNLEFPPKNTLGEDEEGGVTGESDSDTRDTWNLLRVGEGLATGLGIGLGAGLLSLPPVRLGSIKSCWLGSIAVGAA